MHPSVAAFVIAAALGLAACDHSPIPPVPRLALSPESAALALRGSVRLRATVSGAAYDSALSYRSTDTAVVRVDSAGIVRAVGYGGAEVVGRAAARPALVDTMRVSVPEPNGPWIVLRPDPLVLGRGDYGRLSWVVGHMRDAMDSTAVRFISSDTGIVDVRVGGVLCAHGVGNAVVRADLLSAPGVADSTRVQVVQVYDGMVTISISSVTDSAGGKVDYNAVHGAIHVTVLVGVPTPPCTDPGSPALALELAFDGRVWQRSPERTSTGLHSYTFTVDTRATDATGLPLLPNGTHTLSVLGRRTDGIVMMSTSLSIRVSN